MNKLTLMTVGIVVLLAMNAAMLVLLFRPQHMRDERGPGPAAFIVEQLQLDAGQQRSFETLRREHRSALREAQDEDRRLHDAYFSLLKTGAPNKPAADSLSALIGRQRSIMEAATFEHFSKLRALCRPDQQQRFDAIIDEVLRRMGPPPPHKP